MSSQSNHGHLFKMLPRNDLLVKQQESVKNGQYLYPAIKQRGYYSDIVSFGESHKLQVC